jgi:hypothetical protein
MPGGEGRLADEVTADVESPMVIAAATETPSGERAHAVGAHVAEGHGSGLNRARNRPGIAGKTMPFFGN